jgi:hypothetical protein
MGAVPAHDIPDEDWQARALAAEDDLDLAHHPRVVEHAVAKAEALELQLERIYSVLPGAQAFLNDLARLSILPVRSRARMWANTLGTLLPDENDDACPHNTHDGPGGRW